MTTSRRFGRQLVTGVGVVVGVAFTLGQTPTRLQPGDIFLRGGWLFDAVGDQAVRNTGIVVRNGTLAEVGATPTGRDLSAARIIDLQDDEYVLPGLFDLHAHYAVDLFGEGRVDEYTINPLIFLANGVTSTFPAGEVDPEGMMAARQRIDAGEQIGPRIYNSGPYFGTARPGWSSAEMTPARVRADVRVWAARGAHQFKAKGIQPEQLTALIDEAHRHGRGVTGHLGSGSRDGVNPRDAIAWGIDRIEHFLGGDALSGDRSAYASLEQLDVTRPEVTAIMKTYIAQNVFYDATISAYGYFADKEPAVFASWMDEKQFLTPHARGIIEKRLPRRVNEQFGRIYRVKHKEIKAFFDAGGGHLITLGTDHPSWGEFLSGFGSHRELHVLVRAGLQPSAALKIATINGARALHVATRLGTLERGKFADLFVVRGSPLEDIRNTRNVRMVMKAGVLYDPTTLLDSARGKLGPAGSQDADWWKGNVRFRASSQ